MQQKAGEGWGMPVSRLFRFSGDVAAAHLLGQFDVFTVSRFIVRPRNEIICKRMEGEFGADTNCAGVSR